MNVKEAYNIWANQYDSNENKTRDLEATAIRYILEDINFDSCLEIGCGTGKNTEWLLTKTKNITAIDLSEEMLAKAKSKIHSNKVKFFQADILDKWEFADGLRFELATFSLVLEHIEKLDQIFCNLSEVVKDDGYVYVGELHPFKQYLGAKARFETNEGMQIVNCYTHNISDFVKSATFYGFTLVKMDEFFDKDINGEIPRILTLLFKKKG